MNRIVLFFLFEWQREFSSSSIQHQEKIVFNLPFEAEFFSLNKIVKEILNLLC